MTEQYKVLLVEDDIVDRMAFERFVASEGLPYDYITAGSISKARQLLASERFDVALMDYSLGDGNSLELFGDANSIPIIMITGSSDLHTAVAIMKAGAYDFLIKDPQGNYLTTLPITVERTVERWQAEQELAHYRTHLEQVVEERTAAWIEGEIRLRTVVESTPTIVFSIDDEARFTFVAGRTEEILGYTPNELIGKSLYFLCPDSEESRSKFQGVVDGATFSIDIELNGRWLYISASSAGDNEYAALLSGVTGIIHDITERKHAEMAVMHERNLLRTLIDNIPDYIFVKDRDGRFVETNTAHSEAAGLPREDILHRTAIEVFDPSLAIQFIADDKLVLEHGQPIINEERTTIDSEGNKRWVLTTKVPLYNESTSDVVGLVGVSRDVTERRKAEEERRQSDERLRTVVSNIPMTVFELDRDGVFQMVSGKGLTLGLNPEMLLGTSIFDLFGDLVEGIGSKFTEALSGVEHSLIQAIGDRFFDIRYVPKFDQNNNVVGVMGIATDITEQLEAERLRIEIEQERELVELKQRFIATASHDFRTPLTIIKMDATMLERYGDRMASERRAVKLQQIQGQVDHMIELLNDVLTISKMNAGKIEFTPARIELRPYCERIWESLNSLDQQNHQLEFQFDATVAHVVADELLLQQVLVNLLSNAFKYTPPGLGIKFTVDNDDEFVIFRVRDSGYGIPEADRKRLFEPFHRASNVREIEGTGLGLAIAKNYVEMHEGTIEAQSEEGVGTIFVVRIPLSASGDEHDLQNGRSVNNDSRTRIQ